MLRRVSFFTHFEENFITVVVMTCVELEYGLMPGGILLRPLVVVVFDYCVLYHQSVLIVIGFRQTISRQKKACELIFFVVVPKCLKYTRKPFVFE